jgi:hypothetical protein
MEKCESPKVTLSHFRPFGPKKGDEVTQVTGGEMPNPSLPPEIEALISGSAIQSPAGGDAAPLIPPAKSPEEYGVTLPELRENPTLLFHREQWMLALLASSETSTAKMVGSRLALYLNVRSGRLDPSYDGIVRDLGGSVSRETVKRAVHQLEGQGWISVQRVRRGGRKRNEYTLVLRVSGNGSQL